MALAASTTVWEVRTTGSDGNGGGFNTARGGGGVDRSQQDAAEVTIDGVTVTATVQATTTDLAITGYAVSAADLGNLVNITGGTMTAGVYEIVAIPAAGQWRLDRSGGTAAQTGTGAMGGANASPGWVAGKVVDANTVHVKAGTYLITSTTANISGGRVSAARGLWLGYQTTRQDFGTAPVFQASGINTFTLFTSAGNELFVGNITVDGNLQAATRGWSLGNRVFLYRCGAINCTNNGYSGGASQGNWLQECFATGCTTQPAFALSGGSGAGLVACRAFANSVTGFDVSGQQIAVRCLSYANTGATSDGFTTNQSLLINCVSYGNGQHGYGSAAGSDNRYVNCVAESNAGRGWRTSVGGAATAGESRVRCAGFGNGVADGTFQFDLDFITGLVSFFVDPASGDFRLNSAATGGALLLSQGYPLTMSGFATGFNVGVMQQATSAGGAGGGSSPVLGGVWGGNS